MTVLTRISKAKFSGVMAVAAALAMTTNSWAECCRHYGTSCGGVGGCNIFCCNCDGGCRRPDDREYCKSAYTLCKINPIGKVTGGCGLAYKACLAAVESAEGCADGEEEKKSLAATPDDVGKKGPQKGAELFHAIDRNDDKKISAKEFAAHVNVHQRIIRMIDADKDGKFSADEIHKHLGERDKAYKPDANIVEVSVKDFWPHGGNHEHIFSQYDTDKSGHIDATEAAEGSHKSPKKDAEKKPAKKTE